MALPHKSLIIMLKRVWVSELRKVSTCTVEAINKEADSSDSRVDNGDFGQMMAQAVALGTLQVVAMAQD